jgi:flagellar motility protein MotE (MotC chaperone)
MTRLLTEFRLIPIVLVAAAALFTLKVVGLFSQGGYTTAPSQHAKTDREVIEAHNRNFDRSLAASRPLPEPAPEPRKRSWMQDMFFPDVTGSVGTTGAIKAPQQQAQQQQPQQQAQQQQPQPQKQGEAAAAEKKKPIDPPKVPDGTPIQLDPKPLSAAERALLERLTQRREELEKRARELDVRETLLLEAEKRLEARTGELKDIEARISAATEKKEEADRARLKSLVTMYENMKAKDAARIFDRLEIKLATEVASQINPRRMSDIMAQMAPEAAERLTVELANRGARADRTAPAAAELPKIEGRPNGS